MPIEVGGLGKSHLHYSGEIKIYTFNTGENIKINYGYLVLDELFNDILDIREYFLEQNEVINNHILYMNQ